MFIYNIVFHVDCVDIRITDLLKHSNLKNSKFTLKLKKFEKNPAICVVEVLQEYLKRTRVIRGNEKQLLISFSKPYAAVTTSTILRWIKSVLFEAGINVSIFKAHSTRAASCSKAKREGVPIKEILKHAGWRNNRTFEKYYDKCIMDD